MKLEEAWPLLRNGARLRNGHWEPNMFIVLQKGYPEGIPINRNTAEATGIPEGEVKVFRPYIMLHCVDGSFVPYVATQSDLLTEMWEVADNYDSPFPSGPHPNPTVIGYNFEPGGHDDPVS